VTTYSPLVLDLGLCPPGRMSAPRLVGSAVEGGASLSGIVTASDATGGGLVAVDYSEIQLSNVNRDRILFFSRLMNALAGGVRFCVVPLLTDYIAPYAGAATFNNSFSFDYLKTANVPTPAPTPTTFSDGASFDDLSSFAQPPVAGAITAAAAAGAATVTLTVVNGRYLQGGEWFGVQHPNKSFRAYCVTDVDAQANDANGVVTATVGIRPTLRDVLTIGMTVDWWRPRCLMRIKSGADPTLDLTQFWFSTPSLSFIEAF